jgi:hypothetical protein
VTGKLLSEITHITNLRGLPGYVMDMQWLSTVHEDRRSRLEGRLLRKRRIAHQSAQIGRADTKNPISKSVRQPAENRSDRQKSDTSLVRVKLGRAQSLRRRL